MAVAVQATPAQSEADSEVAIIVSSKVKSCLALVEAIRSLFISEKSQSFLVIPSVPDFAHRFALCKNHFQFFAVKVDRLGTAPVGTRPQPMSARGLRPATEGRLEQIDRVLCSLA